jgi:RNA polymerase-binding protein DksA
LNDAHRKQLETLREELAERVSRTHKHIHERDEVSQDFAEQNIETSNDELVLNLDAEGKDELRLIDAALQRLDDGTYGNCSGCGKAIPESRLTAVPFADQCIDCATDAEQSHA